MSDEQLDKGETGDAVWDAAQYQLALTGNSCMHSPMPTVLLHAPPPPAPPPPTPCVTPSA